MTIRSYSTLTQRSARGPLPPMVSVIIPAARTNLITNSSFELGTTDWAARGGSTTIARSAAQQYHGTYSLAVTPGNGVNDGARYQGALALIAGSIYAVSIKVKGKAGIPYQLVITDTSNVNIQVDNFIATGRWEWRWFVYQEASTTTRRIAVYKNGSTDTSTFYLDGAQVEPITDGILSATTYIDGSQQGLLIGQQPPAYGWNGTPFASTSYRTALTRAGGYLVRLDMYSFLLTGILGLGMAAPNNVSIPYTLLDGARYQRTQKPPRTLALAGRFQADDIYSLAQGQSDMRAVFDRDLIPIQQPLVLQVEPQDECGNVIGDFANIQCLYAGGLEGNDGNYPAEDVAPTFTMYLPYLIGGDAGAALTVQQSVTNANRIIQRTPTGTWQALGTGAGSDDVLAMARGLDGKIYVGGRFTSLGGVANTDGIGYWDPNDGAWHAMGTGVSSGSVLVSAIAVAPNGDVIVGGNFDLMGGVANTVKIARWNGSAWSALSTGLNGIVRALVFGPTGILYIGGAFTDAGGVAAADRIASWDGAAFAALGTGATGGEVDALAIAPGNNLYAGGLFTAMGGVANTSHIARWNGSAWVSIGNMTGGGTTAVYALAVGLNGLVYAGGDFTAAGGISASFIARWNGVSWSPLGTGVNAIVSSLAQRADGALFASGIFTTAGGIVTPDSSALWNGSAWIPLDVDLPSSATVQASLTTPDGSLYLGYTTAGTATAAGITTVTNDTPGVVYPRVIIKGPSSGTSRIYQLVNFTTGIGLWLNLTINAGETVTIDTDPQHPSFTSDFQGDLTGTILPGSSTTPFYLASGANSISFFAAAASVTATPSWQRRYNGWADLVN